IAATMPKIFLMRLQKCDLSRGCFAACAQKLLRNQRQHVDWRGRRTGGEFRSPGTTHPRRELHPAGAPRTPRRAGLSPPRNLAESVEESYVLYVPLARAAAAR